jgi:hypothetical protein
MGTTVEAASYLYSVPDHPAIAMFADGCDGLNRALQTIERMPGPGGNQFKALVVFVPADFTLRHNVLLVLYGLGPRTAPPPSRLHLLANGFLPRRIRTHE